MSARLSLLAYHVRLGLSWAALAPALALTATVAILSFMAPLPERSRDLSIALEGGAPLVTALLAAPLLMSERERNTLSLLATRVSLLRILLVRLALLALYLLLCCGTIIVVAGLLWHSAPAWAALPRAGARALLFAALGALTATWGRSTVSGYLAAAALWLGVLMFGSLLPRQEPWLTLNPFAWSSGYNTRVVTQSIIVYTVLGLVLLLPQWLLLRPERLLRQT